MIPIERLTKRDEFGRAYVPDVPWSYLHKIADGDKESYDKILDIIERLAAWEDNGILMPAPIGAEVFYPKYSVKNKAFVVQTLFVHNYIADKHGIKMIVCANEAGEIVSAYDKSEWNGELVKNIHFDKNECLEHCKRLNEAMNK